ncbi:MAG: substrate-binding domain-containing protein [Victivallales bacterium]
MFTDTAQKQTKHKWLKRVLQNKIGTMHDGQRFPAELELHREFNLSRMTVNKVIMELVRDGFLVRKRPVGTFVSKNRYLNLGIVMPGLGTEFSSSQSPSQYQIFQGIHKYCHENSWDVQITSKRGDILSWDKISRYNISGLLIITPVERDYELIAEIQKRQFPFLCINLHSDKINKDVNYVNIDYFNAAIDAVNYLYEHGRKNIAVINTWEMRDDIHQFHIVEGYKQAIKELGIKEYIITSDIFDDQSPKFLAGFIRSKFSEIKKYDAVLLTDSHLETPLLNILHDNNIKIPEDISIVSLQNSKESIRKGISSYTVDLQDVGYQSAKLFSKIFDDKNKNLEQLKIKPQLIISK